MSVALYRKYRPDVLSGLVGQEHIVEPLERALTSNRLHHAYLFSGPRGCGKTSTARILARSLLCETGPTATPCGVCEFCEALAPTGPGLVDVIELDAASHGGVDDTRDLRERAAFVPAQARFKVYIIDEAHMISKDGFNALLKLIEEPPDHVKFIFATTEVDKVLPTIRSRTFNYTFRLVSVRDLVDNLQSICDAENISTDHESLTLVAHASGGSVRDAQSILGQLIAGSDDQGLHGDAVARQLGVTSAALLDDVIHAITTHNGPELLAVIHQVIASGHDLRRFVTDVLHRFRDLLLIKHGNADVSADVLGVSPDQRDTLIAQADALTAAQLTHYTDVLVAGLSQLKGSSSPQLHVEILAARLLLPATTYSPESVLARLDALEQTPAPASTAPSPAISPSPTPSQHEQPTTSSSSASPASSTLSRPPSKPSSTPHPTLSSTHQSPTPDTPSLDRATPDTDTAHSSPSHSSPVTSGGGQQSDALFIAISEAWDEVLAALRQRSRVAAAAFDSSVPVALSADNELTVYVPNEGQRTSIVRSGRHVMLRTVLVEQFQWDVTITPTAEQPAAGSPAFTDSESLPPTV